MRDIRENWVRARKYELYFRIRDIYDGNPFIFCAPPLLIYTFKFKSLLRNLILRKHARSVHSVTPLLSVAITASRAFGPTTYAAGCLETTRQSINNTCR